MTKMDKPSNFPAPSTTTNVFLFVPNVIGFSRIALVLTAIYYMPQHSRLSALLYYTSVLLDELDGISARCFQQCTRFGSILDIATDMGGRACLHVYLAVLAPNHAYVFQMLTALDFGSHITLMYATLVVAGRDGSHKEMFSTSTTSWMLRLHYGSNVALTVLTQLNQLFFVALYLILFDARSASQEAKSFEFSWPSRAAASTILEQAVSGHMLSMLLAACAPFMLFKQWAHLQLIDASQRLAEFDGRERDCTRAKSI